MILELRNATVGYGRLPILQDVSISVESGEVVCLLGPNGVGKTTMFKSMMRFLPLLRGQLLLDGAPCKNMSQKEFAGNVGYVPQSHESSFAYSVMDVVVMGRTAHLKGFQQPTRDDYAIAAKMLDRLGIGYLANSIYTNISGGERQMVLIARALTQQPKLLLMDEPTANLDYGNQIKVLGTIRNLAADGLGVLMTSHNPDHAFICCTRAVLITRDKKLIKGSVDDVVTETNLADAYQVRVKIVSTVDNGVTIKSCVPRLL